MLAEYQTKTTTSGSVFAPANYKARVHLKKPILGLQAISELKIKFLEVSEKNLCKYYSMMQLISLFYSRKLFGMAGRSHAGIAGSNPAGSMVV
jgi:hypothetical protein